MFYMKNVSTSFAFLSFKYAFINIITIFCVTVYRIFSVIRYIPNYEIGLRRQTILRSSDAFNINSFNDLPPSSQFKYFRLGLFCQRPALNSAESGPDTLFESEAVNQ